MSVSNSTVVTSTQRRVGHTNGILDDSARCKSERDAFVANPMTLEKDMLAIEDDIIRRSKRFDDRGYLSKYDILDTDAEKHRVYWKTVDGRVKIVGYGPRYNVNGHLADESESRGLGRCYALTASGNRCCNFIDARYSPMATCERVLNEDTKGICQVHAHVFEKAILKRYKNDECQYPYWNDQIAVFALDVMSRIHSLGVNKVGEWVFFSDVGQSFCIYMSSIGFYIKRTALLDDLSIFKPHKYGATKAAIEWFGTNCINERD